MNASRPAVLLPVLVILATGCAGYQIGHQTLSRPDIRTVSVPIFASDTLRRDLGEWLTEAVVKEIEDNTAYRIASGEGADSVLTGRLLTLDKTVVGEDRFDVPRTLETSLAVEVSWIDRRGEPLFETLVLPVPAPLLDVQASEVLIPEAGQSITSSELMAIRDLARRIRGAMDSPWGPAG